MKVKSRLVNQRKGSSIAAATTTITTILK
uniref:Uncharacterized protein n=1 Tax=Rhizophora mucronata TaxID=61149 RepID=A0A2P2N0M0_RHIMU